MALRSDPANPGYFLLDDNGLPADPSNPGYYFFGPSEGLVPDLVNPGYYFLADSSTSVPANVGSGTVTARFGVFGSPDVPYEPVRDLMVTFTPSVPGLIDAGSAPPTFLSTDPVVCGVDWQGYLIDPVGHRDVTLYATNTSALVPAPWVWHVSFSNGLQGFDLAVPAGGTVDLSASIYAANTSGHWKSGALGTVAGRFGDLGFPAGGSSDGLLRFLSDSTLLVTLTPTVAVVVDFTASPPIVLPTQPIVCSVDWQGYLIDAAGRRAVRLYASIDAAGSSGDWGYRASFTNAIGPFTFRVGNGDGLDLAKWSSRVTQSTVLLSAGISASGSVGRAMSASVMVTAGVAASGSASTNPQSASVSVSAVLSTVGLVSIAQPGNVAVTAAVTAVGSLGWAIPVTVPITAGVTVTGSAVGVNAQVATAVTAAVSVSGIVFAPVSLTISPFAAITASGVAMAGPMSVIPLAAAISAAGMTNTAAGVSSAVTAGISAAGSAALTPRSSTVAVTAGISASGALNVTTYINDSFTGTNGAAWNSSNWTAARTTTGSSATIQSNQGQLQAGTAAYSGYHAMRYAGSTSLTDCMITGIFNYPSSNGTNDGYMDLQLRANSIADGYMGYYLLLQQGGTILLAKDVNYVYTQLSSYLFNISLGVNYKYRFAVIGSTVSARIWLATDPEPTSWAMQTTDYSHTSGSAIVQVDSGGNGGYIVNNDGVILTSG